MTMLAQQSSLRSRFRGGVVIPALIAWFAVHAVQWASGATYSDAYLDLGWQMVPRETLRNDVLGSVWYLHVQPPLYNLAIGMLLRFSPLSDSRSTQLLILVCSVLATLGLCRLATLMGLSVRAAVALATFLMADPYMIRYELEPTYEIPVLALIVWSLVLVRHACSRPRVATIVAAGVGLTAIVMTRSLFHPLWIAVVLFAVLVQVRHVGWRPILLAASIPTILIGSWLVKNQAVFDDPTLSSWFGMNLERGVIAPMNRDRVGDMIASGQVPEIATVPPFVDYDSYQQYVDPCPLVHQHPAVTQPLRPNGFPDFNYECFLPVYSALSDASIDAVRAAPGEYLHSRIDALKFSADHPEQAGYGHGVLQFLRPVYRLAFLDVRNDVDTTEWFHPLFGPGKVIVYPSIVVMIAWLVSCWELCRRGRRLLRRVGDADDVLVAVATFTVLWVVVVGAAAEMGENARFRSMVHPVLMLVAIGQAVAVWRKFHPHPVEPVSVD